MGPSLSLDVLMGLMSSLQELAFLGKAGIRGPGLRLEIRSTTSTTFQLLLFLSISLNILTYFHVIRMLQTILQVCRISIDLIEYVN